MDVIVKLQGIDRLNIVSVNGAVRLHVSQTQHDQRMSHLVI